MREREYRWLLNYNTESGRYDFVGTFSNYSGKDRNAETDAPQAWVQTSRETWVKR